MSDDNAHVGIEISVSGAELQTLIRRLQETDKEAKKAGAGTDTFAGSVKAAGKSFLDGAAHATRLHHALRIMHHLTRIASEVFNHFRESLSKSLEFRFNDDAIKRSMASIERSSARFLNTGLDKFAPLLVGISKVLTQLTTDYERAGKAGQKLAAKEVIEWFAKLGPMIVDVGGFALGLFARAVLGVRIAWNGLFTLVNSFFEINTAYLGHWIENLSLVASAIAPDSTIAKGLNGAADAVYGLAKEFERSGDESAAAIAKDSRELDELDAKIDSVSKTVKKGIADAASVAMKNLGATTHWATEKVEGLDEALKAEKLEKGLIGIRKAAQELVSKGWGEIMGGAAVEATIDRMGKALAKSLPGSYIDNLAKVTESMRGLKKEAAGMQHALNEHAWETHLAQLKRSEEHYKRLASITEEAAKAQQTMEDEIMGQAGEGLPQLIKGWQTYQDVVQNLDPLLNGKLTPEMEKHLHALQKDTQKVAESIGNEIGGAIYDVITGAKSLGDIFDGILKSMLKNILNFVAQQAVILFLSLFTGGAGGPALGGLGILGKILGFASGGPVTGGIAGRDSVPALLTPGEYVLPVDVVNRIQGRAGPQQAGHFASGGMVKGGPGVGGTIVHNEIRPDIHVFGTVNQSQVDRLVRDSINKSIARLNRLNYANI